MQSSTFMQLAVAAFIGYVVGRLGRGADKGVRITNVVHANDPFYGFGDDFGDDGGDDFRPPDSPHGPGVVEQLWNSKGLVN